MGGFDETVPELARLWKMNVASGVKRAKLLVAAVHAERVDELSGR